MIVGTRLRAHCQWPLYAPLGISITIGPAKSSTPPRHASGGAADGAAGGGGPKEGGAASEAAHCAGAECALGQSGM